VIGPVCCCIQWLLLECCCCKREEDVIPSGVLCITTHHQSCVCQMRRPINLSRSCEGGYRVGSRLRTIRSLLGGLCSTIQGFQHSDALFRDSAPPPLRHDFPPLLRRCCAYLKPSLLGSCRAATAHLSLRRGSQNTQQQWVGDVLRKWLPRNRDYHTRAHPAFVASHIEKVRCHIPSPCQIRAPGGADPDNSQARKLANYRAAVFLAKISLIRRVVSARVGLVTTTPDSVSLQCGHAGDMVRARSSRSSPPYQLSQSRLGSLGDRRPMEKVWHRRKWTINDTTGDYLESLKRLPSKETVALLSLASRRRGRLSPFHVANSAFRGGISPAGHNFLEACDENRHRFRLFRRVDRQKGPES
jgi:hypothetical protein